MGRKQKDDTYFEADKHFYLNDRDPSLRPICISLPDPPDLRLIDGYGLPPEEQRFRRVEYPPRLKALEEEVLKDLERREAVERDFSVNGYTIYNEFWTRLDSEFQDYQTEIDFIKRMWWHRINGYWCFIKGKPTYISGPNFTYLNFFYLGEAGQFPEYRDRDRRWFLAVKYAWECTETFKELDKDGHGVKRHGHYEMVDDGVRKFLGMVNSKGRRIGDTTKAFVLYHEFGVLEFGGICGIISFGGESAQEAFKKKLIPAWQRMPLWMKPMYSNNNNPSTICYEPPRNVYTKKGLGTTLNAASSGSEQAYDSKAVKFLIYDEAGKDKRHNAPAKWSTLKYCLMEGEKLKGFSIHPTTVEEMEDGGGKEFYSMMEGADFYVRMKDNGRTKNDLLKIFFRASDGMAGAIDSYGYSVEFEPTDWQRAEGFKEGMFHRIEKRREQYRRSGKPEDMALYRENQRKQPIYYMDSFVDEEGGLGFDYIKIGEAISRLNEHTTARRYNILRDPSNFDGPRRLVPDEKGKFHVSIDLGYDRMNQKIRMLKYDHLLGRDVWTWRPRDMTTFVAGADPITFMKKREAAGTKRSKAAGCVFWNYDPQMDKSDNPNDWSSFRTVVTYLNEVPTEEEYNLDMLDMCILFQSPMYTENNKTGVWETFLKYGYDGYLIYDIDPNTGRKKDRPGVWLNDATKQKGFNLISDYIQQRMGKEQHLELVEQMDKIRSFDDLKRFDLLSAFMCALLGAKSSYSEILQTFEEQEVDINDLRALF